MYVERLKLSYTAGGNLKWYDHFGKNSLAVSYKIKTQAYQKKKQKTKKHRLTMWSSNSTPKCYSKRNKNICPPKRLVQNVHCSFICIS